MTKPNSFKALLESIRLKEIKRRMKAAFRRKPRTDQQEDGKL